MREAVDVGVEKSVEQVIESLKLKETSEIESVQKNHADSTRAHTHRVFSLKVWKDTAPFTLSSQLHLALFLFPAEVLGRYSFPEPLTTYSPLVYVIFPRSSETQGLICLWAQ